MNKRITLGLNFEPREGGYIATLSIQDLHNVPDDVDRLLRSAACIYSEAIGKMRTILAESKRLRKENKVIPAVLMWDIGDTIFKMLEEVASSGFKINDLYAHLVRDLGASKSTLKRVVSVRRYIPERDLLSKDISWGSIKDAPKRYARERIING